MRKVNDGADIAQAQIPNGGISYSLNEWHTIKIEFGPGDVKSYLDDVEVMSLSDPTEITVDMFFILIEQQITSFDDLVVTMPGAAVTSPGKIACTWAGIKVRD